MREIKFRAWDKEGEKIIPIEEVNNWRIGGSVQSQLFEIMQYTGLKDKNGVEIYEGDVVKRSSTDKEGVVEFHQGQFVVKIGSWWHSLNNHIPCEIKGNIYE